MIREVKFESQDRRIKQILAALNANGIKDIEEANAICEAHGLDPYKTCEETQPICFENAKWAYVVGCAIAIKKGCTKAADAAEAIGEGLQSFCIPGSVADERKVGLGHGNLAAMLNAATTDADSLYHNDAATVSARYDGTHALKAAAAWWYVLSPSIKELQKQRLIAEAQVVDQVLRRAVEPGNNFYSVEPVKVSDHIWLMSGMLIFYVIYTLWYGFAIFELFEGVGLAMTKSKVKQEG